MNDLRRRQRDRVSERSGTARKNRAKIKSSSDSARTILNVIDEFDHGTRMTPGRVALVPERKLKQFAEDVAGFWDGWSAPDLSDQLTVHSGAGIDGKLESGAPAIQDLLSSVLYYPRATFSDLLADLTGSYKSRLSGLPRPRPLDVTEYGNGFRSFWDKDTPMGEKRLGIRNALEAYEAIRPLIEARVLVPIPEWKIVYEQQRLIRAAIERDVADQDFFDLVCASEVPISSLMLTRPGLMGPDGQGINLREAQLVPPSFYLNKMISISNSLGSRYVPRFPGEQALLFLRIQEAVRPIETTLEAQIIPRVASIDLPGFTNLNAQTLVDIRENEDALDAFRAELQQILATAVSQPGADIIPGQISAYVNDQLGAKVNEVNKLLKRPSLGAAVGSFRNELIVGIATGLPPIVDAAATGHLPSAAAAGTGLVLGAAAAAVLAVTGRRPLDGSQLVISGLLRAH